MQGQSALCNVLIMAVASALAVAGTPRIGDPESVFDPAKDDDRFANIKEWAKAGVEGGIPRVDRVLATLKPGDDLYKTLQGLGDSRAAAVKGVVLLKAGTYRLDHQNVPAAEKGVVNRFGMLWIPSGVVLRGEDRDKTVLEFSSEGGHRWAIGLKTWSAVENLTLLNTFVRDQDPKTYIGKYQNFDDKRGKMGGIGCFGAKNCWVQNCRIQYSGSHPLMIEKAEHVTLRDNIVEKGYNKGGGGASYYFIFNSRYVLMYNETVRDIRHISLQNSNFSVLIHCYTQVDVNWHAGDDMGNTLVERCTIDLHPYHQWHAIAHYLDPVKPGNILYRVTPPCEDGVWSLRTNYEEKPWLFKMDTVAPKADTFYAVTGAHDPSRESGGKPTPPPVGRTNAPPAALPPNGRDTLGPKNTAPASSQSAQARAPTAQQSASGRKEPSDEAQTLWIAKVIARLKDEIAAGRKPEFLLATMHQKCRAHAVDAQNRLVLEMNGSEVRWAIAKFRPLDFKNLAMALLRTGNADDHCMAAFFLLWCDEKDTAMEHLNQGGEKAATVRAAYQ